MPTLRSDTHYLSLIVYMHTCTDKYITLLAYPYIETCVSAMFFFFSLNSVINSNIQHPKIKIQKLQKIINFLKNRIVLTFYSTKRKKIMWIHSSIFSFYFVMIYYAISKLILHFIKSFNASGIKKSEKRAQPADLLSIY